MVLTEKVRYKISSGQMMAVWYLTAVAAGANNISGEALGFKTMDVAVYDPQLCTISATTTGLPICSITTNINTVVIGQIGGSGTDSGTLTVYGS